MTRSRARALRSGENRMYRTQCTNASQRCVYHIHAHVRQCQHVGWFKVSWVSKQLLNLLWGQPIGSAECKGTRAVWFWADSVASLESHKSSNEDFVSVKANPLEKRSFLHKEGWSKSIQLLTHKLDAHLHSRELDEEGEEGVDGGGEDLCWQILLTT